MILPDFVLFSRINQQWQYSGIDSPEHCRDRRHFENYPWPVSYCYNSRGFRDTEWPGTVEELKNAIWCVGDSFTVGLGSPWEHTWPCLLQQITGIRTINVSMDGASNDWILRKAQRIIEEIQPRTVILQWSYLERYEHNDLSQSDEDRRRGFDNADMKHNRSYSAELREKIKQKIQGLNSIPTQTQIIHTFIPGFDATIIDIEKSWNDIKGPDWPDCPSSYTELENLPDFIKAELISDFQLWDLYQQELESRIDFDQFGNVVSEIIPLDRARDGHHYDILTSQRLCQHLVELIR